VGSASTVNLAVHSRYTYHRLVQPTSPGAVPVPPRRPVTWWWFFVPLFTFGLGTFIMVLVGGVRLRVKAHIAAAIGYFILTVYFFVAPRSAGGTVAFLIVWLGGIAHVLVLQMQVHRAAPLASPMTLPAAPSDSAIVAARRRIERRGEARRILATNPALAAELRIGRPDLPRQYDDGGLVDVNHVPVAVLTVELELASDAAAAIVRQRDKMGGFSSAEELMVYTEGLTTERVHIIEERLVFVPV